MAQQPEVALFAQWAGGMTQLPLIDLDADLAQTMNEMMTEFAAARKGAE